MGAYNNIKELCKQRGIAVTALEKELGFGRGSIGKMKQGTATSTDRMQKIADYFGVTVDYLMNGKDTEDDGYYINEDARELAQFLFENPDYKVLFDASRNVKREDLEFVKRLIDKFNGNDEV